MGYDPPRKCSCAVSCLRCRFPPAPPRRAFSLFANPHRASCKRLHRAKPPWGGRFLHPSTHRSPAQDARKAGLRSRKSPCDGLRQGGAAHKNPRATACIAACAACTTARDRPRKSHATTSARTHRSGESPCCAVPAEGNTVQYRPCSALQVKPFLGKDAEIAQKSVKWAGRVAPFRTSAFCGRPLHKLRRRDTSHPAPFALSPPAMCLTRLLPTLPPLPHFSGQLSGIPFHLM